jgi:hypothetical protein
VSAKPAAAAIGRAGLGVVAISIAAALLAVFTAGFATVLIDVVHARRRCVAADTLEAIVRRAVHVVVAVARLAALPADAAAAVIFVAAAFRWVLALTYVVTNVESAGLGVFALSGVGAERRPAAARPSDGARRSRRAGARFTARRAAVSARIVPGKSGPAASRRDEGSDERNPDDPKPKPLSLPLHD